MKNTALIVALLTLTGAASAQEQVENVIQRAMKEHPRVKAAIAALDAEKAGRSELSAPFRPMASANGYVAGGNGSMIFPSTVEPINLALLPPDGAVMGNLMLMWRVWTGGRDSTVNRLGDARVKAAEHMLATVRQDVSLGIRLAYAELDFRMGAIEAAKSELAAALEMERVTSELERNGRAPRAFVLRASAAARSAEKEVAMAEAAATAARAEMDEAAGGPVGSIVSDDGTQDVPSELVGALQAAENRSELRFMLAMAESMGLEAESVRRSLSPEVSLMAMGGTARTSRGDSMNDAKFGLVFSIPLTDGGMRSSRTAMLRAKARELMAQAEEMRLTVRKEVESAWAEWASVDAVTRAADAGLASASEAYDVEKLRYENGRATAAEHLDALASLTRARKDILDAQRYARSARARLQRAVGAQGS
jgi:outer membrane protein TolC